MRNAVLERLERAKQRADVLVRFQVPNAEDVWLGNGSGAADRLGPAFVDTWFDHDDPRTLDAGQARKLRGCELGIADDLRCPPPDIREHRA